MRGGEARVEPLGDVDVLVEPRHRVPELLLLQVERGVVLAELVLAVAQRVQDAVEVALGALVLAEVVGDLVAERDHPEQLLGAGGLLRVEVLDRPAQLEQRRADLGPLGQAALLERLDRRLQQPVGGLGGLADVAVAHGAHVGGLRGELRRARARRSSASRGSRRPSRPGRAARRRRRPVPSGAAVVATGARRAGAVSVSDDSAAAGGCSGAGCCASVIGRSPRAPDVTGGQSTRSAASGGAPPESSTRGR